ncbi:MAG: ketoacyl-ACP synthase III [Bacteroidia bacterium]|nr:ketoacyl-ACP synthase III [Bacteroidia bacterium]
MSTFKTSHVAIKGIVSCVPKEVKSTFDYSYLKPEEQELFYKTVGIKERRVANDKITCSDLCQQAAEYLFNNNITKPENIDLIVFVSQSPDYFLPSTAVILQDKLKLKKTTLAFDVTLGCSGYVYGLSIVSNFLQSGQFKQALLLCGDKSTISTYEEDKSAYPLFGDAGTATLLEYDSTAQDMNFALNSDGSGKNAIIIEHGHSRHPYSAESDIITELEPGVKRAKKHLALNGQDIFTFALKEVTPNVNETLQSANKTIADIDYFVMHQANKLINETVRKKLGIDKEKYPYSIELFGNTSSASIPLTMCYALESKLLKESLNLLLCGFGVGLSWGSVILRTNQLKCAKLIEL